MDQLVSTTLEKGFVTQVVPEFAAITVGQVELSSYLLPQAYSFVVELFPGRPQRALRSSTDILTELSTGLR